jgi:hypothetical protein
VTSTHQSQRDFRLRSFVLARIQVGAVEAANIGYHYQVSLDGVIIGEIRFFPDRKKYGWMTRHGIRAFGELDDAARAYALFTVSELWPSLRHRFQHIEPSLAPDAPPARVGGVPIE